MARTSRQREARIPVAGGIEEFRLPGPGRGRVGKCPDHHTGERHQGADPRITEALSWAGHSPIRHVEVPRMISLGAETRI